MDELLLATPRGIGYLRLNVNYIMTNKTIMTKQEKADFKIKKEFFNQRLKDHQGLIEIEKELNKKGKLIKSRIATRKKELEALKKELISYNTELAIQRMKMQKIFGMKRAARMLPEDHEAKLKIDYVALFTQCFLEHEAIANSPYTPDYLKEVIRSMLENIYKIAVLKEDKFLNRWFIMFEGTGSIEGVQGNFILRRKIFHFLITGLNDTRMITKSNRLAHVKFYPCKTNWLDANYGIYSKHPHSSLEDIDQKMNVPEWQNFLSGKNPGGYIGAYLIHSNMIEDFNYVRPKQPIRIFPIPLYAPSYAYKRMVQTVDPKYLWIQIKRELRLDPPFQRLLDSENYHPQELFKNIIRHHRSNNIYV